MIIYVRQGPEDYHGSPLEVRIDSVSHDGVYFHIFTDQGEFKRDENKYDMRTPYGWEKVDPFADLFKPDPNEPQRRPD